MQTLYDIHTHQISQHTEEGYRTISILNRFPFGAEIEELETVYYSCGIHPWYLESAKEQFDRLKEVVQHEKVVAIGEAGLDKLRGGEWKVQIEYFRKQIELAQELDKPLIIHCVKAWNEVLALSKEYKPQNTWIIHGFRGKPELAEQLVSQGIKLSLGRSFNPEILKRVPLEFIFCETDDFDISILSICVSISNFIGISVRDVLLIIQNSVFSTFKM